MSERERTIIRVAGLLVHAVGFVGLVLALAGVTWLGAPSVAAFLIGGAWGWGMVAAAARSAAEQRREATAAAERERAYRDRKGFTASFDDEAEPLGPPPFPRTIGGA